jgi:hypothetical protein
MNCQHSISNSHFPAVPSYPAHAGYPVNCDLSTPSLMFSEYWIVHRSLSSGAHSREPLADDGE